MSSPLADRDGRVPPGPVLLCVAHPGHELRVHGWLGLPRPVVCVLTDGSGRSGKPRLGVTRALVEGAGAAAGSVFGRLRGDEAGAATDRYLEVRYEDLVVRPEAVLRDLCAFVDLPFDARQLEYHVRAPERLLEHGDRLDAAGRVVVSRATRLGQQHRVTQPPDPTRVGRLTSWEEPLLPEVHGD